MTIMNHSACKWVLGTLVLASLGLSTSTLAANAIDKRTESAKLEWSTPDLNHPVVAYRVLDKTSSSYVLIHINQFVTNNIPSASVTVNGCSGENNLNLLPGESYECLVKSTTPLTVVSNNATTASGFSQFLAKGPK